MNETTISHQGAGCSSCAGSGQCAGACAGFPYVCLDIKAQIPAPLRSRTHRVATFEVRTMKIESPAPGVDGPFADYNDFLKRGVIDIEQEVRVYKVVGHAAEIIVPVSYNLDEVRSLRQEVEDLTASGAEQALIDAVRQKLAIHHYGDRIIPEDIVTHLDELPDSRYLGTVYLLDQSNSHDLWNRLNYDRNFVSSASVKPNGDIMFYRGKKDIFLRDNVFHEWAHRLEQKFKELSDRWADTLELENGEVPRTYAFRAYDEHFAVFAEEILALDCGRFLKVAGYAPLRVPVWLAGLKKALTECMESRPSCYHILYSERVRYGVEVLKPLALKYLDGARERALAEQVAATKALADKDTDDNRLRMRRRLSSVRVADPNAAEPLLVAEVKAARVRAFLKTWLV